ncbi:MAG: molybdopterin molybdotransferase MoeA [Thermodesulfobacteriota bacterium]
MLDMHTALERLLETVEPMPVDFNPVTEVNGRVVAEDLHVTRPFPDSARSAVDGYALGSCENQSYIITRHIPAGVEADEVLQPHEAAAVMTGACVPQGSVAVVRVEDTRTHGEHVEVHAPVERGSNINIIGEEAHPGDLIIQRGERVSEIGSSVLCYAGLDRMNVYRAPKVGILITGPELLEPGETYQRGKTYNSNCYLMRNVLAHMGMKWHMRGPVDDDPEVVERALEELTSKCDVVVTSGGISMGKYDYVRPLLLRDDEAVLLNRTRIKPGRPLVVSRLNGTLCFGMPGYPSAFLTNMFVYLLPVLKKIAGWSMYRPAWRPVWLSTPARGRQGRSDLLRARLRYAEGRVFAVPLDDQITSHYLNMAGCDALLHLDTQHACLQEGELVPALIFRHELD